MNKWDKWDHRYLQLARNVASWSKDPNAVVGAVIVNEVRDRVIALGFNGFPVGIEDDTERLYDSDVKNEMVIHAEQNALLFAGRKAKGCSIYVSGKPVCARCAVLIIQAGITRVVARKPKEEPIVVSSPKEVTGCKCNGKTESKWDVSGRRAWGMFIEAGIDLVDTSHLDEGDIQPDKFNLEAREAVLAEILGTKIS
jgi:dCMP deaminase